MKIAVCDDEKIWCDNLEERIRVFYGSRKVECKTFSSGEELIAHVRQGKDFDAYFLDIELQGMNGIDTANILRKLFVQAPIVFLTSHTEMAMEGYEVAAFRFLSKPIVEEKFSMTLSDIEKLIYENRSILLKQEGEEYIVDISRVIYIEAQNNSVRFVCEDREYICRMKISDAFEKLYDIQPHFCRVHRGFAVNFAHVKKQTQNEIYMDNGHVIPIGRSYMKAFRGQLMEYVRKNVR